MNLSNFKVPPPLYFRSITQCWETGSVGKLAVFRSGTGLVGSAFFLVKEIEISQNKSPPTETFSAAVQLRGRSNLAVTYTRGPHNDLAGFAD